MADREPCFKMRQFDREKYGTRFADGSYSSESVLPLDVLLRQ